MLKSLSLTSHAKDCVLGRDGGHLFPSSLSSPIVQCEGRIVLPPVQPRTIFFPNFIWGFFFHFWAFWLIFTTRICSVPLQYAPDLVIMGIAASWLKICCIGTFQIYSFILNNFVCTWHPECSSVQLFAGKIGSLLQLVKRLGYCDLSVWSLAYEEKNVPFLA